MLQLTDQIPADSNDVNVRKAKLVDVIMDVLTELNPFRRIMYVLACRSSY